MTDILSVKAMLHAYASSLRKEWKHDRSKTVGASEIGGCQRRTRFDKHGTPRDEGYIDSWGGALRGTVIENHYCVPGVAMCVPAGWDFLNAGNDQHTLSSGYLSATPDGMLVNGETGETVVIEFKSIDPRADLSKEKASHHFQAQVQLGLIRETTEYKPDYAVLVYVNASFYDDITEFFIPYSPRIYQAAQARARDIMTADNALGLPPEGKMAGGDECKYCAWASHCAEVTVAGVPKDENELDADAIKQLLALRDAERGLLANKEEAKRDHAEIIEDIKEFLRAHDTRRVKGEGWSVSYSVVGGRSTLDTQAVEAAGLDLSAYYKPGKPAERIVIR